MDTSKHPGDIAQGGDRDEESKSTVMGTNVQWWVVLVVLVVGDMSKTASDRSKSF